MFTRVQLEKNKFAEYHKDGYLRIYENNNNGDYYIKIIFFYEDCKTKKKIHEYNNDGVLLKKIEYCEDGKTIDSIFEYDKNGFLINVINCKDDKNYDDGIIYCFDEEEFNNMMSEINNKIDCINATYDNEK